MYSEPWGNYDIKIHQHSCLSYFLLLFSSYSIVSSIESHINILLYHGSKPNQAIDVSEYFGRYKVLHFVPFFLYIKYFDFYLERSAEFLSSRSITIFKRIYPARVTHHCHLYCPCLSLQNFLILVMWYYFWACIVVNLKNRIDYFDCSWANGSSCFCLLQLTYSAP